MILFLMIGIVFAIMVFASTASVGGGGAILFIGIFALVIFIVVNKAKAVSNYSERDRQNVVNHYNREKKIEQEYGTIMTEDKD